MTHMDGGPTGLIQVPSTGQHPERVCLSEEFTHLKEIVMFDYPRENLVQIKGLTDGSCNSVILPKSCCFAIYFAENPYSTNHLCYSRTVIIDLLFRVYNFYDQTKFNDN